MELGIMKIVSEIFKSAPRAGLFLAVLVILIIATAKLTPIFFGFVKDLLATFLASRSREQTEMINIIKAELNNHREESARQFALNERMAKSVEGSLESLRELTARTASMDHRLFDGVSAIGKTNAEDHKAMLIKLDLLDRSIQGLS